MTETTIPSKACESQRGDHGHSRPTSEAGHSSLSLLEFLRDAMHGFQLLTALTRSEASLEQLVSQNEKMTSSFCGRVGRGEKPSAGVYPVTYPAMALDRGGASLLQRF